MSSRTKKSVRSMAWAGRALVGAALLLATAGAAAPASADDAPVVVKAGTLHIGDGRTIEHGVVVIINRKITAVGASVALPAGAVTIDVPEGSITPGLIDANAMIEPTDMVSRRSPGGAGAPSAIALMFHDHSPSAAKECWSCSGVTACAFASIHETLEPEQICPCCGYPTFTQVESLISGVQQGASLTEASAEVVPYTRVIDTMNLRSPDFERLVLGGVTTVFVSPDSAAVIGPQGAIVRTAGPIGERVVKAAADVKAAMGTDSYTVGIDNNPPFRGFVSVRTRRPNTRMGVTWVFRKAFYDTKLTQEGLVPSGADTPPAEAFGVLGDVLSGTIPLRMQARMQQDILTAIRLTKEFGLGFTLLDATEAYKCTAEIKAAGVPVVFGPISSDASGARRFSADVGDSRLSTFRGLVDAGIPVALSAQDLREEDGLARQGMYAVRAGATTGEALRAMTLTPAKLLGIDADTGSIEAGKRADLVVWTGQPFDATSRPVVVLVGGRTVMDLREAKPSN